MSHSDVTRQRVSLHPAGISHSDVTWRAGQRVSSQPTEMSHSDVTSRSRPRAAFEEDPTETSLDFSYNQSIGGSIPLSSTVAPTHQSPREPLPTLPEVSHKEPRRRSQGSEPRRRSHNSEPRRRSHNSPKRQSKSSKSKAPPLVPSSHKEISLATIQGCSTDCKSHSGVLGLLVPCPTVNNRMCG